jgi:hypothetical protein
VFQSFANIAHLTARITPFLGWMEFSSLYELPLNMAELNILIYQPSVTERLLCLRFISTILPFTEQVSTSVTHQAWKVPSSYRYRVPPVLRGFVVILSPFMWMLGLTKVTYRSKPTGVHDPPPLLPTLILLPYLFLDLSNRRFPRCFPTRILYACVFIPHPSYISSPSKSNYTTWPV